MKIVKVNDSRFQQAVKKWQKRYAAGEISWDETELILKILTAQYQSNQIARDIAREVRQI